MFAVNRKTKVALCAADPTEVSAYYRATGPLVQLSNLGLIEVTFLTQLNYVAAMQYDIFVLVRPTAQAFVDTADIAHSAGKPVWVDYDDDLFNLPYEHKDWDHFNQSETRECIATMLRKADVVTVTTETLAEVYRRYLPPESASKVRVIPNAIDDLHFPALPMRSLGTQRFASWRGGFSHTWDLVAHLEHFKALSKANYRFAFFGHKPVLAARELPVGTWTHYPWSSNPAEYFSTLKLISPPVHLIALEKNKLNASKSNIAWLESTWFGGSVSLVNEHMRAIGSAWAEPGMAYFNSPEGLVQMAEKLFEDNDMRTHCFESSLKAILEKYLLSNVNLLRTAIIAELTK